MTGKIHNSPAEEMDSNRDHEYIWQFFETER
jgi:hypothetical protein